MTVKTVVLGEEDTIVKYKINGVEFECFPLDDLEFINEAAIPKEGEPIKGEPFCRIIQERLKRVHGVSASLGKCADWYSDLVKQSEEQQAFFAGSPASSGPTDSLPQAGKANVGADGNSATANSGCSNTLKTRSKPKSSPKRSSTSTKTEKAAGTT